MLSWSWSSSSSSSSSSSASEKARKVEVGDSKEKEAWNLREKGRDQGRTRENERVVDETSFDSGTLYEIECESSDPQKPKGLLEEFFARKRERSISSDLNKKQKKSKTTTGLFKNVVE
ncbi:hypothetical protein GmHk_19G053843 [Glycine max]|nr:hypothetical protein GmHk_19G053843 [Glycine max]